MQQRVPAAAARPRKLNILRILCVLKRLHRDGDLPMRRSTSSAPNKLVVWCYNQLDSFRSNDGGELWSPSHPITEPSISVVVPIANKVGEATLLRSIELSIN